MTTDIRTQALKNPIDVAEVSNHILPHLQLQLQLLQTHPLSSISSDVSMK